MARARGRTRRGPRHPVALVGLAAIGVYAATELLVARSVTSDSWWRVEWVRLHVRVKHPAAPFGRPLPAPGWPDWVPSAVSAVLVVGALALLALLLAASGRGWWLLAVAALPLLPVELAPGLWGPPVTDTVAYALVWLPGATSPTPLWAWVGAVVAALTVAVPAAALHVTTYGWRPGVPTSVALRRLAAPAVVVAGVVWWQWSADRPPDARVLAWQCVFFLTGALVTVGALRRPRPAAARTAVVVVALAVLPVVAAGAVTWTAAVNGPPVWAVDPSAWVYGAVALGGIAWVLLQPTFGATVRRAWAAWRAMLAEDVASRDAVRRGPSRAGPVPAGGRHRA